MPLVPCSRSLSLRGGRCPAHLAGSRAGVGGTGRGAALAGSRSSPGPLLPPLARLVRVGELDGACGRFPIRAARLAPGNPAGAGSRVSCPERPRLFPHSKVPAVASLGTPEKRCYKASRVTASGGVPWAAFAGSLAVHRTRYQSGPAGIAEAWSCRGLLRAAPAGQIP